MPEANQVGPNDIAEVVARWAGIPPSKLLQTERQKLLQMEKILARAVVGQPEAVKAISNAVRRPVPVLDAPLPSEPQLTRPCSLRSSSQVRLSRSGLGNENRPIASFLLCGPSGTGKTLLAKTLATFQFDAPDAMMRIDASEYSEKHSIARLIGSPPGCASRTARSLVVWRGWLAG